MQKSWLRWTYLKRRNNGYPRHNHNQFDSCSLYTRLGDSGCSIGSPLQEYQVMGHQVYKLVKPSNAAPCFLKQTSEGWYMWGNVSPFRDVIFLGWRWLIESMGTIKVAMYPISDLQFLVETGYEAEQEKDNE